MLKIIPPHRVQSVKVDDWKQIKYDVQGIREMIVNQNYEGNWKEAYSIHHSQVSERPFNFFVVNLNSVHGLASDVIINPEIIERMKGTAETKKEGCMSYPFRPVVKVKRYDVIKVQYQVKRLFGFKTVEMVINEVMAQVFQHDNDHAHAIYIYD